MPKFYVTSGQIREIITAQDAEGAALEALERFFEPLAWVFSASELSEGDRRAYFAVEALTMLEAQIRVSEAGFEANLADLFNTADLVDTHFRLTAALSRWEALAACDFVSEEEALAGLGAMTEWDIPALYQLKDAPLWHEFQRDESPCPILN